MVSMINVWTFFYFLFCVRKLIATFDKWELWISCRGTGAGVCTYVRISMLCHSALGYLMFWNHVYMNRLHEVLKLIAVWKIAEYVLTILLGNVSRMMDFDYFFYLCIDMQYGLSQTSFIFWCKWAKFLLSFTLTGPVFAVAHFNGSIVKYVACGLFGQLQSFMIITKEWTL